MDSMHVNTQYLVDLALSYLPRLALAIFTLVIGLWLIRLFGKFMRRLMNARSIDESLHPFIITVSKVILTILLLISVMGMIGIEMTSFIALLGAAGISIGMALSGSLQHFAGGILLLIYKPFKKGDFIEAQGNKGTVVEIGIFSSILSTVDNKLVFIPNGPLSTGTIINYSANDKRKIDHVYSISYSDDISKAKQIIKSVLEKVPGIITDPEPIIGVNELAASSVNIMVRAWVKTTDFMDTDMYLRELKQNLTGTE
jgi:small conductance mechanosensitive channel